MGKFTINGPFLIAMLNYQRVTTINHILSMDFIGIPLPPSHRVSRDQRLLISLRVKTTSFARLRGAGYKTN